MKHHTNIDLSIHSEEVHQMLKKPPRQVYRLGNSIILIFLGIVCVVSLVLKFPVTSDAEITFNTFSDTTWVVHAYLPDKTIAHIIPGERIVISLLAYPAEKNGFITGKVQNIHLLKSGQGVNLELTSEKELVTDRHIKIMLVGPMNGRAIIITGYQSLLERIIHGTNR